MADVAAQPTPVQSVYGWHNDDRLFVNRRYQRKLVWTLEEKQKLVESILKKYPIPAILVAERDDDSNRYEIIDGLQRLNAIISFIEGAFPTVDGKYFDVSKFPTAQTRREADLFEPFSQDDVIGAREVGVLLDYSLAISIMRKASEREIDDVFDRINSYGHRLSDQERRQAGIQNAFSELVRKIACTVRGDESETSLPLAKMPSISIDLPMTKHGYLVRAEEVFWVDQGILRSTDLRDSMDEQCIADIAACIITGSMIERSKAELDSIYDSGSERSNSVLDALKVYGPDKLMDEMKFCMQQIEEVCNTGRPDKLRNIIFERRNTNAFPAVFSVIFVAFHEMIIMEKKRISDYPALKRQLTNLTNRIETSRRATSPEERRTNVNTIKGIIGPHFINQDLSAEIYSNHASVDIDSAIRRSSTELSYYELKQGLVSLGGTREFNEGLVNRIIQTICAMANNGPSRAGKILIGVSDSQADADRAVELDKISPRKVGEKFVVGVDREARLLGVSLEDYIGKIRHQIGKSTLSDHLKTAVLSSIDYNSYYGLGVIVITVPPQTEQSLLDDTVFWRDGDNTKAAESMKQATDIARRF
ncbi:GmrSD restriction endonuclease domain-containing protein [Cereibacter sphaeroides]|uniref:GmrSD restriction endonuclease domain-containing protein n=1 Tax=Cereibacter sphaeroides TaxID=1063 RepID=UPI001F40F32D|nr:DUF262 domain-containing protein [Cereibacter sphaeroides]MCE6967143.1 DUF262 domain-containing protein [Cereibacter sphaeroides]